MVVENNILTSDQLSQIVHCKETMFTKHIVRIINTYINRTTRTWEVSMRVSIQVPCSVVIHVPHTQSEMAQDNVLLADFNTL